MSLMRYSVESSPGISSWRPSPTDPLRTVPAVDGNSNQLDPLGETVFDGDDVAELLGGLIAITLELVDEDQRDAAKALLLETAADELAMVARPPRPGARVGSRHELFATTRAAFSGHARVRRLSGRHGDRRRGSRRPRAPRRSARRANTRSRSPGQLADAEPDADLDARGGR
jgi:hypothetical protein